MGAGGGSCPRTAGGRGAHLRALSAHAGLGGAHLPGEAARRAFSVQRRLERVHVDHGFASVRKYLPLSELILDYHDPPLEPGMLVATPDAFLKALAPDHPTSIHPIGDLAV